MNYHNISHNDIWNGEGTRTVLFVSGCKHNCPGCQNPQTHDKNSGILFDSKAKAEIYASLNDEYIDGLTISGGDPFHIDNIDEVLSLCSELKFAFPDKTIWIYTGYTMDNIKTHLRYIHLSLINRYVDVIVDGPFIQKLANKDYPYAGSTNQKIWKNYKGSWKVIQEGDNYERKAFNLSGSNKY